MSVLAAMPSSSLATFSEDTVLIEQVKTFQRSSRSSARRWQTFIQLQGLVSLDPCRHKASILREFMLSVADHHDSPQSHSDACSKSHGDDYAPPLESQPSADLSSCPGFAWTLPSTGIPKSIIGTPRLSAPRPTVKYSKQQKARLRPPVKAPTRPSCKAVEAEEDWIINSSGPNAEGKIVHLGTRSSRLQQAAHKSERAPTSDKNSVHVTHVGPPSAAPQGCKQYMHTHTGAPGVVERPYGHTGDPASHTSSLGRNDDQAE